MAVARVSGEDEHLLDPASLVLSAYYSPVEAPATRVFFIHTEQLIGGFTDAIANKPSAGLRPVRATNTGLGCQSRAVNQGDADADLS